MLRFPVVCFDVGFTLLDERVDAHDLIGEVLQEFGLQAEPSLIRDARRATNRWYHQRYHSLDNNDWSSDATIRTLWLEFYQHLFDQIDPSLDHAALGDRLIAHYEQPENWVLFADVRETLDSLHAQGIRIGIVSDWASSLRPILTYNKLLPYFDFAVISADAGYAKPMTDLYQLAIKRAGVAAEQIIHIGDSYYADVLGARAVGMQAALIDRHKRVAKADCPILHDLRDLLALV
ncbi:HAD-IA family hydrolase [Herpetosiphon sp. NSE202]|uniref:HAD-IA family hydrolase n=1 Tax=Herpetosiphon sp. NSE202 TaxID=3351349 RepID=UPI00363C0B26